MKKTNKAPTVEQKTNRISRVVILINVDETDEAPEEVRRMHRDTDLVFVRPNPSDVAELRFIFDFVEYMLLYERYHVDPGSTFMQYTLARPMAVSISAILNRFLKYSNLPRADIPYFTIVLQPPSGFVMNSFMFVHTFLVVPFMAFCEKLKHEDSATITDMVANTKNIGDSEQEIWITSSR